MVVILSFQLVKKKEMCFISYFSLGSDYAEFYKSSLLLREGKSPYLNGRYVTPPIPAIVNIPLTFIPFRITAIIVSTLSLLSLILSSFLVHRVYNIPDWENDRFFLLISLTLLLFSYPFYFLYNRGNIDGFVLLFMCIGVYCLRKYDAIAGCLFAFAISFKVYPILVILPLIGCRRWKTLIYLIVTMSFLFLLSPQMWIEFFMERILTRCSSFSMGENASLANTFFYIGLLFKTEEFFKKISFILYLSLLILVFFIDYKRKQVNNYKEFSTIVIMYIPFMLAVPQLVYNYELVCLLPMLPVISWQSKNSVFPMKKTILSFITVGIALSQFQAIAAEKLFETMIPHFIPGFGLAVVLIGVTFFKMSNYSTPTITLHNSFDI
jgi:hypothetical protein